MSVRAFPLFAAAFATTALPQDPSPESTATKEYGALVAERDELSQRAANAATEDERARAREQVAAFPLRILEFAERHPGDPVAAEALIGIVLAVNGTSFPQIGETSSGTRALALLQRDHARSEKLGPLCQWILYGFHASHEALLRAVLKESPHRDVRGIACYSLAQLLCDRSNRLDLLEAQDGPELATRYDSVFGKEFMDALRRRDRAAAQSEAIELFARAASEFADVTIPVTYYGSGGRVGERAERELYLLRHLVVGKTAPDIEGEDQDGVPFHLRDYAGKVVLLDFWNYR